MTVTIQTYLTSVGQWAFRILDDEGLEIAGGAGFDAQEEAQDAAFDIYPDAVVDDSGSV